MCERKLTGRVRKIFGTSLYYKKDVGEKNGERVAVLMNEDLVNNTAEGYKLE